jgi:recombination protein RecT
MTTELAKISSNKRDLKELLYGAAFQRELGNLLPHTMSPERFVRIAFQATHRNPDLLKCTRESFFNCLLGLGTMGLEPDGRRAHLIPYGTECTLIVDYKGIAEVLRRNHDVTSIHCDVVYSNDEYEAEQGTNQHLRHKRTHKDRGVPVLAYSFVRLPDGSPEFEEMSVQEIEVIRKRSKTPNKGPWVTDWDAMARKTVFRKHSKMLPLSPETRDVIERDDDGDALADAGFSNAQPARAAVVDDPEDKTPKPSKERSEPIDQPKPSSTRTEPRTEPTLVEVVSAKLDEAGFTESELLNVLRGLKFEGVTDKTTALTMVAAHVLRTCVTDWDNAVRHMVSARAESQKIGQQNLSV